jgi:hypothetical protein
MKTQINNRLTKFNESLNNYHHIETLVDVDELQNILKSPLHFTLWCIETMLHFVRTILL